MIRVEVVAIGSELLNGDLADAHTARFGRVLRSLGLGIVRAQTVPDDLDLIVQAFTEASGRADLVLVTGGLGSTDDDLTMEAASLLCDQPLHEDGATLARLKSRYRRLSRPFSAALAKQALIPYGALALDNDEGSAPAVRLKHDETTFFFFPGVPRELDHLIEVHLIPWLSQRAEARPRHSHTFKTYGRSESGIAALLDGLSGDPRLHVAYRASFPRIQVTLHVEESDPRLARAFLDELTREVRTRLGRLIFTETPDMTFPEAVANAVHTMPSLPSIAVAESCTGGLIAKLITDVSGASAWFHEGLVTYSNAAKTRLLGVEPGLIDAHGAVSEQVARAMAEGVRQRAQTRVGLATTGIAGPGGGSPTKPVGTVHIAMATEDGTEHRQLNLPFNRERNRVVSAWATLDLLRQWAQRKATTS